MVPSSVPPLGWSDVPFDPRTSPQEFFRSTAFFAGVWILSEGSPHFFFFRNASLFFLPSFAVWSSPSGRPPLAQKSVSRLHLFLSNFFLVVQLFPYAFPSACQLTGSAAPPPLPLRVLTTFSESPFHPRGSFHAWVPLRLLCAFKVKVPLGASLSLPPPLLVVLKRGLPSAGRLFHVD